MLCRGQVATSQAGRTVSAQNQRRTAARLLRSLAPLALASVLLGITFLALAVSVGASGIAVSKTVSSATVTAGNPFTYTIYVTNTTGLAIYVTITDAVPSNVSVTDLGGGTLSDGIIAWGRGPIANGTITQVTFSVVTTRAGSVVNADYRAFSDQSLAVGAPVTTTIVPAAPDQISLTATPNPVTVAHSSVISVSVVDRYGNPLPDASEVALTFDRGTMDGQPPGSVVTGTISGGYLTKTLVLGTMAGTARVTATAGAMVSSIAIQVQPDAPANLDVVVMPTTIPANGIGTATITATVADQYNNLVTGLPVTLTTSLGRLNNVGPAVTLPTNTLGQVTATLTGTTAGTATLNVIAGSLTDNSHHIYLAPGAPSRLALTADPASITANGTSTSSLTLQILDAFDNRVDTPVAVTLTTNLGSLSGGGSTTYTTTSNGLAQTVLTAGTVAGTAAVTAQAGGLITGTAVDIAPGPADHITLVALPTSIPADGASTTTLTATVRDQYANPVRTPTVVTLTAAAGTLLPDASGTTANGVLTRTLRSNTTLGTVPVTATAAGLAAPAVYAVEFVVGPPSQAEVAVSPTPPVTAGQVATLTITVRDSVGHLVPGALITPTSTGGVLTPPSGGVTDGSGVLTRTLLVTQAGVVSLSATGSAGPLSISGGSVQVVADSPAQAVITATPTSLVANGTATAVVTATVSDRFGNPVTGFTPVLTASLGSVTEEGSTNSAGVVTRTFTAGLEVGTAVISATGLTTVTPAAITLTAGSTTQAVITASATSPYVYNLGSAFKPDVVTLTIRVMDAWDHPIVGQTMTVTSTLGVLSGSGATDSTGVLTRVLTSTQSGQAQIFVEGIPATGDSVTFQPGPLQRIAVVPTGSLTSPVQMAAGVLYTFTAVAQDVYYNPLSGYVYAWSTSPWIEGGGQGDINASGGFMGSRVGTVLVLASAGGKTGVSYVRVNPGVAAAAVITASPLSLPADGASTSNLQLQILDAYGNRVGSGIPVTVTSSIGIVDGSTPTDSNGTVQRTIRSFLAGRALLGVTNMQTVTGHTVITFTAGVPQKASVQVNPATVPANGVATSTLRITLLDAYNNPVGAGYAATVQTTLGTLSGSGVTDASGVLTRTLTAPLTAGTAGFTVRYLGVPLARTDGGVTVQFVVGPMDHISTTPAGPLVVVAGDSVTLVAQGYDAEEAPIPAQEVTYGWVKQRFGSGDGLLAPLSGSTTAFTGTTAGDNLFIRAWALWSDQWFDRWLEVTVLPGPPTAAHAVASTTSITADGASPITFTLSSIVDAFNNPVADGVPITLTLQSTPAARVGVGVVNGGQATVVLTAPTRSGTFPVTAMGPGGAISLSGDTQITFLPGAVARATTTAVIPAQLLADGVSTCTLVLQLYDAFDNPVSAGVSPAITANLGATVLDGGMPTDANGVLTRTLQAGAEVGQATIYVNGVAASGARPALIPGPPVSAAVVASRTELPTGGQTATLVFTVRDAWNHLVADGAIITPTLTPGSPLAGLSGNRAALSGVITQTLTSGSAVGTTVVGAEGLAVTGDTLITIVPGPPAIARVTATPANLPVGGTTTLVISVTDAFGNLVPPSMITVTSQLGTFEGGGSTTLSRETVAGLITTTLSATVAGTDTLTFVGEAGAMTLHPNSDQVRFTPGSVQQLVLDPTGPLTLTAGSPITLTATSRDAYGNPVDPWSPITYAWRQASSPGDAGYGQLSGATAYSRSVRFTPQRVGANQVWATGAALTSNVLAITVLNGPAARATVTVDPASVPADGATPFVITLTQVTDAFSNVVPDGTPLTITVASNPPRIAIVNTVDGAAVGQFTAGLDAGQHAVTVVGPDGPLALTGATSVQFLAGTPINAAITAWPTSLVADGASTAVITVTVSDAQSNPVRDGTPITVTTTLGTLSGGSNTTVNGIVTRTLRAPVALGTATFGVEAPIGSLAVSGDTVEFMPGPAAQAWVDAEPANLIADGVSTSQVAILIKDANGFVVRGESPVQLGVVRGTVAPTATIASFGVVTATYTAGNEVGAVGLTITYDGVSLPTFGDSLQLTGGPPSAATLTASPTSVPVASATPVTLQITVLDVLGRPVPDGTPITVTTSLGSIVSNAGATLNGSVTRQLLAGTVAGTATITVTTPSGWLRPTGDTVRFTPGPLATIELSPPGPLQMTACTSQLFRATGYDQYHNPLGSDGYTWLFHLRTGNGILAPTGWFTATMAGAVGIQAQQGFYYSPILNITIVPGSAITAHVRANPSQISIGGRTSELTISAWDACGNPVADGTQLTVTASGGTVSGSSTTRGGTLTRTLTSPNFYADPAAIYVNGWLAAGDRVTFVPGVYAASMTATPPQLYADGRSESLLTITVSDAAGLPLPDGTQPTVAASLGTLTGNTPVRGGVVTRTLRASLTPGTARVTVDGTAVGEVPFIVGPPAVALIKAQPTFVMADGSSVVQLTITVQDAFGHTLATNQALDVAASLGTLGGVSPTVNGVTTRQLTAPAQPGVADISVAGLTATGDTKVYFMSVAAAGDIGFEGGINDWATGRVITPPGSSPAYATTLVSSARIGALSVTPHGGAQMVQLGATTADNTPHQISQAYLRRPLLVPTGGTTQITFWYRMLSFDVAVGSPERGSLEWDAFKVLLNGREVLRDGLRFSDEWYRWYLTLPTTPRDLGWKQGVLDVTAYAGQVVTLEFRLGNLQSPVDNTWVFLDDVVALYTPSPPTRFTVFLPTVRRD